MGSLLKNYLRTSRLQERRLVLNGTTRRHTAPYLYLLGVLALDLVCPSAFLFLYLLVISVVNVNDTICATS